MNREYIIPPMGNQFPSVGRETGILSTNTKLTRKQLITFHTLLLLIPIAGFIGSAIGFWQYSNPPDYIKTSCKLTSSNNVYNGTNYILHYNMRGAPDYYYNETEIFDNFDTLAKRINYLSVDRFCYCKESGCVFNYNHPWVLVILIIDISVSFVLTAIFLLMLRRIVYQKDQEGDE